MQAILRFRKTRICSEAIYETGDRRAQNFRVETHRQIANSIWQTRRENQGSDSDILRHALTSSRNRQDQPLARGRISTPCYVLSQSTAQAHAAADWCIMHAQITMKVVALYSFEPHAFEPPYFNVVVKLSEWPFIVRDKRLGNLGFCVSEDLSLVVVVFLNVF